MAGSSETGQETDMGIVGAKTKGRIERPFDLEADSGGLPGDKRRN
jgi:hypothetical protein